VNTSQICTFLKDINGVELKLQVSGQLSISNHAMVAFRKIRVEMYSHAVMLK
jgi:hypothetical protein